MTSRVGLRCSSITKRFPGTVALDDVDISVEPGEVVALIGENGAGKSTLVKVLSGVHQPDYGTMTLDGEPHAPSAPAVAIEAGIGMIHQETNLFPELSVAENVLLGRWPIRQGRIDYPALFEAAAAHLTRVGLHLDPRTPAGDLSVAGAQQVDIAKALSLDARYLILDEPTAALGAGEVDTLFSLIEDLRQEGTGFVYISHRLSEVGRIADRIVVLRDGRRVAGWETADVAVDALVEAMVGRAVEEWLGEPPATPDGELLVVDGLARTGEFADVSFALRHGEILGIAGLVGAGRTELARSLCGAAPPEEGTVTLDGSQIDLSSPAAAVEAGIVLVPEDRKQQGLVLSLSLEDNIALPSLRELLHRGVIGRRAVRRLADGLVERLQIRGRTTQAAGTLSGGNQQKAVVGKWLPRRPKVIVFDEPTRGVDVGAKVAIHRLIGELAAGGTGVIVISSELPEVLGIAHRVLVLAEGKVTGLLARAEATEETVMRLAVNG